MITPAKLFVPNLSASHLGIQTKKETLPRLHDSTTPLPRTTTSHTAMSREAYQVPTQAPAPGRDAFNVGSVIEGPAIIYTCGDCSAKVPLKRGDPIRCKECRHRVLYKERTKR